MSVSSGSRLQEQRQTRVVVEIVHSASTLISLGSQLRYPLPIKENRNNVTYPGAKPVVPVMDRQRYRACLFGPMQLLRKKFTVM